MNLQLTSAQIVSMHFDRFLIGKVSTPVQLLLDGALEPVSHLHLMGIWLDWELRLQGAETEPQSAREASCPLGVLSAFCAQSGPDLSFSVAQSQG